MSLLPRRQIWILLPGSLLGALLTGVIIAAVRGTWASSSLNNPTSPSDPPTCQILQGTDGSRHVRAAMLVQYSVDQVWGVVTGYDQLEDICSCVHPQTLKYDPDRRCRIRAQIQTGLGGTLPVEADLHEEQDLYQYRTSWDEPWEMTQVNRGGWTVTSLGPDRTLVEVRLEVEVAYIPTFVLRNISMYRLPRVLLAVEHRLRTGQKGASW